LTTKLKNVIGDGIFLEKDAPPPPQVLSHCPADEGQRQPKEKPKMQLTDNNIVDGEGAVLSLDVSQTSDHDTHLKISQDTPSRPRLAPACNRRSSKVPEQSTGDH
jgi:hypothetical protein